MEGEPSNSSTKSMLSQQSPRGAPPSEIETSPLYRVVATESAIGLAIFIITFRVWGTIVVESINSIQG